MNLKILLSELNKLHCGDKFVVTRLYTLSSRSIFVAIVLATLTTIGLYPVLHNSILLWFGIYFLFSLYRFYDIYYFKNYFKNYSMRQWHRKFLISASISAFLFSSLAFLFIYQVDSYYQLFIYAVLIGLSSGSLVALSPDIRLSIGYIAILLSPLMFAMLFFHQTPLSLILALSLPLYFMTQVITVYKIYIQKEEIEKLKAQHILLDTLFKNAPLAIFTYNKDLEILDCNKRLSTLFDHEIDKIIGVNLHDLIDTRPVKAFKDSLTQGPQSYEGSYVSLNGNHLLIEAKAFSFSDNNNTTLGGVGMVSDKTKELMALAELEYMVQHDALTGLLNRRGFMNSIEALIKNPKHETFFSILFYLDLNQFKSINDSLGHAVGDEVLLGVSKRVMNVLDKNCIVSRLGGDEFIIMVPHIAQEKKIADKKISKISTQIQNVFLEPHIIQEMHLHIQASTGIVLVEPGYSNIEEMIRYADLTMYQAKGSSSNISYYDPILDKQQKDLFILQNNLVSALTDNQLKLFIQPIAKMKDNTLYAAELLIRWAHPTRGLLSPNAFIPLAIKAGLLSKITWWIVDELCQQIAQWKNDKQWKLQYISINIAAQQLLEKHFAKEFLKKLKAYGLNRGDIMLEITERSLIDNFKSTQGVINDLRTHGVLCAIDDFGIGYSSLSYLKKLSFNTLKIDREFVKDINHSPKDVMLISTILDIGRQFNYNIVIEGIENEEQKSALLKIDEELSYQGYLFSKAISRDAFTKNFLVN